MLRVTNFDFLGKITHNTHWLVAEGNQPRKIFMGANKCDNTQSTQRKEEKSQIIEARNLGEMTACRL